MEGKFAESLGLYRESLLLAEAIGDRLETSFEVEGIAMSLAGLGEHAASLRLIAATRAELARHGVNLPIRFWDELHERHITPARAWLGTEQAEAAARTGREMSFEVAVAEARMLAAQTF